MNDQDGEKHHLLLFLVSNYSRLAHTGQCTYKLEASKRGALRISAWKELSLSLSYTMECTIAGCDTRAYKGFHLGVEQLKEIGRELIFAMDEIGTSRESIDLIAAKTDFSRQNLRYVRTVVDFAMKKPLVENS